jgi:integrase/recombinase XerC
MAPSAQLSFADLEARHEPPPTASVMSAERGQSRIRGRAAAVTDRAALAALETALTEARASANDRPPLVVLSACLASLGAPTARPAPTAASLRQARDDWLRRLASACRSESAHRAYRNAIDNLLRWSEPRGRDLFEEGTIVDYLAAYQERAQSAPATYYRRFVLLRRFLRWVSRRDGVPDPFLDLEPPPKPRQERDWLERDEFRRLLEAAGRPERNLPGLAARDCLVLRALVTTGLRRSELCGLDWRDLELEGATPSLLVRRGKGGKPRRQPLPPGLANELRNLRNERSAGAEEAVFCGLAGRRLQRTTLAAIIQRTAARAGLEKHVTAHTLRHTAATWLRQELGDARLVAEYLGHADLSTVARYAHIDRDELFAAADRLERLATRRDSPAPKARHTAAGAEAASERSRACSVEPQRPRRRGRRGRRRRHR